MRCNPHVVGVGARDTLWGIIRPQVEPGKKSERIQHPVLPRGVHRQPPVVVTRGPTATECHKVGEYVTSGKVERRRGKKTAQDRPGASAALWLGSRYSLFVVVAAYALGGACAFVFL